MSRTWRGEWQQVGMGHPRATQQNEAFSLLGGFRGKIKEVFDKNTLDRNGKPMGFTHCTVLLDFGLPPQFRVPVLREKLNMTDGEDIPPERDDWVMLVFLHGNIDLPIIVGYLPPPQNEGVNKVETEKVATEPQFHRHWKDTDWRSDKDHHWIESFPKDHRRRVKKEIHDAGDDKRYIKTKDAEFHEAKGIATKVKEDDALKADRILRKAVTLVQFSAPRIEMGGVTQDSGSTFKEAQVGNDGRIAPQADQPQSADPAYDANWQDGVVVSGNGSDQAVLDAGVSHLGTPYAWGGTSPDGMDCSGFTSVSMQEAGVQPLGYRTTAQEQFDTLTPVSSGSEGPGNLVFFGTDAQHVTHVGIVSNPNNFQMINAPHSGAVMGYGTYNPGTALGFRRAS